MPTVQRKKYVCFIDPNYFVCRLPLENISIFQISVFQIFPPPCNKFEHYSQANIFSSLDHWHYIHTNRMGNSQFFVADFDYFPFTLKWMYCRYIIQAKLSWPLADIQWVLFTYLTLISASTNSAIWSLCTLCTNKKPMMITM